MTKFRFGIYRFSTRLPNIFFFFCSVLYDQNLSSGFEKIIIPVDVCFFFLSSHSSMCILCVFLWSCGWMMDSPHAERTWIETTVNSHCIKSKSITSTSKNKQNEPFEIQIKKKIQNYSFTSPFRL